MIGSFHGIAIYRARVHSRAAWWRHQRLFGGARFYEEYQVKSLVFGKYQTGPAYRSQIIDYTPNVDIDTMPVMLKTVNGIAQAHADKTIVLVGCGDNYVALVAQAKDAHELADNIVAPYAPYSMLEQCQKKEIFYELCEKHGVPYPHTFTFTMAMLNAQGEAPAEVLDQIDFLTR